MIDKEKFIKSNNLPEIGSKIVVAMSGGVDSAVTAAILKNIGYDVVGVTMKLYEASSKKSPKTCCSGIDIADARSVAKKLGIKHYIIDYKDRFKASVIDRFVSSYINGHTPIPCIMCNQTVKFVDLINFSKSINCDILATGHYVKRVEKGNEVNLYQADDILKDQSYFLFSTTQEQLKSLRFPLGNFTKKQIREMAEYFNLVVANKPDSQDICFIPDGDYRDFVRKKISESEKVGQIVDLDGNIIGKHNGIINYTIGQRKGIGVGGIKGNKNQVPLYVLDINKKKNTVIVGPREKLMKFYIHLENLNFFTEKAPSKKFRALIKIRSGKKLISATIELNKENKNKGTVKLLEPEFGVAPGQACVFYNNYQKMIGGGWIASSKIGDNL